MQGFVTKDETVPNEEDATATVIKLVIPDWYFMFKFEFLRLAKPIEIIDR